MTDSERVFTDIYDRKVWGGGSGGGSNPQYLGEYIALVESLLKPSPFFVLDIGCGVGWIAKSINWGDCEYLGIDVVESVVEQAWDNTGRGKLDFLSIDATNHPLPTADLVLIKEVTQHLDFATVHRLLKNVSHCGAVLHTSVLQDNSSNDDIEMGQTSGRDLDLAPFNLNCKTLLEYQVGDVWYLSQLWRPNGSR